MDHFGPNVTTGADMTVNLVFWQNSLSIHQAPFLKAVAEQAPAYGIGEVVLNVERSVNSERRAQGWSNPDYGPVRINVGSERPSISAFGAYDQHIFSGFCETAFNRKAFESALQFNHRPIITLETPRQNQPIGKALRSVKYRFLAWRYRAADFALLPKGSMGVDYYKNHGFVSTNMQAFAYFPQPFRDLTVIERQSVNRIKFIFVGKLTKLKNLGPILALFADIKDHDWSLEVVGVGPLVDEFTGFVKKNGLSHKVTFSGALDNAEAQRRMAGSDYLILPSLHDGWGAVVNESLLVGTPVIVSSGAGSSCLIRCPALGYTLDVTNREQMREVLKLAIARGQLRTSTRKDIQQWAVSTISADVGAAYFLSLVKAHRSGQKLSSVPVPWQTPLK